MTTPAEDSLSIQYVATEDSPIVTNDRLAIPFDFRKSNQIVVEESGETLKEGTDYEVVIGLVSTDTVTKYTYTQIYGYVKIKKDIPLDDIIMIYRKTPKTQESKYRNNKRLDLKSLENSFDKLTMIVQEQGMDTTTNTKNLLKVQADIEELESRTDAVEQDVDALNTNLSVAQTDITTLKAKITTNTTNIASNTAEIAKVKPRVSELETENSLLKDRVKAVEDLQPKTDTRLNDLEAKAETIEEGAQANKIETVTFNGEEVKIVDKNADIRAYIPSSDEFATKEELPTKVSELENDTGYLTEHQSLDGYATQEWVDNKHYLTEHQDISNLATKEELTTLDNQKQDDLISGINIKTINYESILGEGNLSISGGGSAGTSNYQALENLPQINDVTLVGNKTTEDLGLFNGDYTNLTNAPTGVSAFDNDAGYLTEHQSLDDVPRLSLDNIFTGTNTFTNTVALGSSTGNTTITGGSTSSSSKMVLNASPSSKSGNITISRTSDKINKTNTYIDTMSVINTTNHMLIGTDNTAKNTYVKTNKLYRYNNKSTYEVLDENNFNDILDTAFTGFNNGISNNAQNISNIQNDVNTIQTNVQNIENNKQDKLTAGEGIKLENNTLSSTVQGVPIGTVYPCLCTADYVPSGALPCDGTEYTKEQFTDLWDNYFGKSLGSIDDFELTNSALRFNGRMARGENVQVFVKANAIYLRRSNTLAGDGVVSTKSYAGTGETLSCGAIDETNQRIVVVGLNGFTTYCDYADPTVFSWTTVRTDTINWVSVAFGDGLFVAVGGGKVATSPDGINWDIQDALQTGSTTPLYFNDVIYDSQHEMFIAVGAYGCSAYYSESAGGWTYTSHISNNTETEIITEDLERIVYNEKHDVYLIMGTSKDKLYLATYRTIVANRMTPITVTGRDSLTPLFYVLATAKNTVVVMDKYTIRWCNNFFDNLTSSMGAYSVSFDLYKSIQDAPYDCAVELDSDENPIFYTWGGETAYSLYTSVLSTTLTGALLPTCTYTEYQTAISTYGSCAKFGIDLTNNKFKVPTIKDGDYITQAKSNDVLNNEYKESLPNIKGSFSNSSYPLTPGNNWSVDGCIEVLTQKTASQSITVGGTSQNTPRSLGINASQSSSTYQDGAKVQGDNVRLRYFVQVSNGTISDNAMDWSAWASGLQGKANIDLDNLSDTGKKVIDGQWVNKIQILSSDTNIGVYTLDLSEYLPNDNYVYEVELFGHVRCDNSNPTTFIINDTYSIATKSSIGSLQQIYLTIPVLPTDRTIKKEIQKVKLTSTVLTAIRYRRIGTNE